MTSYVWKSAISGDWATTLDWSPAGVPNAIAADVSINQPGAYTVTIGASDPGYTADSVTLADGTAILAIAKSLTLGGARHALVLDAGQVVVQANATLAGAAISLNGGLLSFGNYATLSGDTISGRLALDGAYVDVSKGLTVTAPGGGGGTIDMLDAGSGLYFTDTETLDNATILTGAANSTLSGSISGGQTLTLGAHATLVQAYGSTDIFGTNVVNQGDFLLANGHLIEDASIFTNTATGTISLSNGEQVSSIGTLANAGTLNIGAGSELIASGTFTNTGVIDIAPGGVLDVFGTFAGNLGTIVNAGTLEINGSFGLPAFAALSGTGVVDIVGTLNLGGFTLDIGAATGLTDVVISGELADGTVKVDGGTLSFGTSTTLDGVTYLGNLVAGGRTIDVTGGLTVETAAGGTPGTIDLSTFSSTLDVLDSETLSNVTLLQGGSGASFLSSFSQLIAVGTLTFAASAAVVQSQGTIEVQAGSAGQIINEGTWSLGGGVLADSATFDNYGTIALLRGESFNAPSSFDNEAGGVITVASGATLSLGGGLTNAGTIEVAAGGMVTLNGTVSLSSFAGVSGGGLAGITGTLDLGGGTLDCQTRDQPGQMSPSPARSRTARSTSMAARSAWGAGRPSMV